MKRKITEDEVLGELRQYFRQNPLLDYDTFLEKLDSVHTDEINRYLPEFKPEGIKGVKREHSRTVETHVEQKQQETKRDESTMEGDFIPRVRL